MANLFDPRSQESGRWYKLQASPASGDFQATQAYIVRLFQKKERKEEKDGVAVRAYQFLPLFLLMRGLFR